MPKFDKKPTGTRKQTDPRDFFSWSTPSLKVSARPTDPYVKPGEDPNVSAFLASMKNVQELTDGYIMLQDVQKKDNAKRGALDARKPEAPETVPSDPEAGLFNLGFGYQEAYNLTMGEDRGRQYHDELLQGLKERNHFQNEENPDEAYKAFNGELYAKHFETVQDNKELMFGAAAQVQEAVNRGALAMHEANTRTFKETFTAGANRVQQGLLSDYARGDHSTESAEHLRKVLADEWEWKVKPANLLTRDEYSRLVVNNIGSVALRVAEDPTMTTTEAAAAAHKLAALFDAPDANTKLTYATMTDGGGAYKFRSEVDHFTQRLNATIANREEKDRQAVKDRQEAEAKDLFANVVLNPELSYEQKQEAITAAKYIKASEVEDLVQKAYTYHNEERHITEDFQAVNGLRERIEMAETQGSLEKLRREVMKGYGSTMNASTSRELQGRITSRIDHIQAETRANRGQAMLEAQEDKKLGYENLVRVVSKEIVGDPKGGMAGAQRINTYGRLYFNRVKNGEAPVAVAKDLIDYFNETQGNSETDYLGHSRYASLEELQRANLPKDQYNLELKKLVAKTAREAARAAKEPKKKEGLLSNLW